MLERRIDPSLDERLTTRDLIEPSLQENYLGSRQVVGAIVADFCLFVRDLLVARASGQIAAEEFTATVNAERDRLAVIIAGEDPEYPGVDGWNDHMLGFRLRVALGSYWQQNRAANDSSPYKALFSYLSWAVFDSVQKSGGDPDLEEAVLVPITGHIISVLLGADKKVGG